MIWNFLEEPGRFIIMPGGSICRNKIDPDDFVSIEGPGFYLYDTKKQVIFPAPQNILYVVEMKDREERMGKTVCKHGNPIHERCDICEKKVE